MDVIVWSTFICTPPSASVTLTKPKKSISTTWSIRTPVYCSTVSTISGRPPHAYAALSLAMALPPDPSGLGGTCTHRSRGSETT